MKLSESLHDVGQPVAYFPQLARLFGSINAAIFFAQLFYWHDKKRYEYVYKTAGDIEAETALTVKEQRNARRTLCRLGVIREQYARLEHRMHFWVITERLNDLWSNHVRETDPIATKHGGSTCPKGSSGNANSAGREQPSGHVANSAKGRSISEKTPKNTKQRENPSFGGSPGIESEVLPTSPLGFVLAEARSRNRSFSPAPELSTGVQAATDQHGPSAVMLAVREFMATKPDRLNISAVWNVDLLAFIRAYHFPSPQQVAALKLVHPVPSHCPSCGASRGEGWKTSVDFAQCKDCGRHFYRSPDGWAQDDSAGVSA